MSTLPFRTNTTSLSDDELILLDVLFDKRVVGVRLLKRSVFAQQWNLGYCHGLSLEELTRCLRGMLSKGILDCQIRSSVEGYGLTTKGGQLWSSERCPDWSRFCEERYKTTLKGNTLKSVVAVSPEIRDDFLRIWPEGRGHRRVATINDFGLVYWHPFPKLYVGSATYYEPQSMTTVEEIVARDLARSEREERLRNERSWWRAVDELQKFVTGA